jgi:RNA polymerase sigma factor, sigma-70 family
MSPSPHPAPGQPSAPPTKSSAAPGDEDLLLRDLVQAHAARLHRFIAKHVGHCTEAEDLAQQAFAEAAASYRQFRGESQLSTWLYGIALNLVRNYLSRAPERRYQFVDESALADQQCALGSAELVEQKQSVALLQQALAELPPNMREVLLLVGLDGMSYEDAAALLTVPVGTVRSRLSRARSTLREKLAARGLELDF